jgi:hypothetical protein
MWLHFHVTKRRHISDNISLKIKCPVINIAIITTQIQNI